MLFVFILRYPTSAQSDELRQFIESKNTPWQKLDISDTTALREFYRVMEFKPAFTENHSVKNKAIILDLIGKAADEGLEPFDYQYEFLQTYNDSTAHSQYSESWIIAEVKFADAALHYFRDIAFGNTTPLLSYNGIDYQPGCISVPWQLAKHIQYNSLDQLVNVLQPEMAEIRVLKAAIRKLRKNMANRMESDEFVTSTKVNATNTQLLKKLYSLGVIDSVSLGITEKQLLAKVKEAQRLFGLLDDGVIRSTFLKEINISMSARVRQLSLSINYYRWLYCLSRVEPVVVVNIPAAYLQVYSEGKVVLEMRTIVGKTATPTPTLSSRIKDVILYPYWTVPHSIATKELLPAIKRDHTYIDANNYQVLDKYGKIMDPSTIDWSALSTGYFPYIIRQSTGCDNALGLLKLDFYNPFSVYLHDTPSKSLFMLNKRFFSHGCMRLENPIALGYLLLEGNSIAIDTLEQKGCLLNQSPVVVPVRKHLPVVVWYNPAGTGASGKLLYYEDVYKKFSWMK